MDEGIKFLFRDLGAITRDPGTCFPGIGRLLFGLFPVEDEAGEVARIEFLYARSGLAVIVVG